jgi:hypothetical protein
MRAPGLQEAAHALDRLVEVDLIDERAAKQDARPMQRARRCRVSGREPIQD